MTKNSPYLEINRDEFMSAMQPYFSDYEMEQIEAAYFFSKYAHRGQNRADGRRYFEHPRAVAWILFSELHIYDWKLICTALLHDIIEDSFIMRVKRLELNFGYDVAMDVKYMSKEKELSDDDYWQRFTTVNSWRAVTCKLADRLHNLRTLSDVTPEKRKRKIQETKDKVLPLCDVAHSLTPKRYQKSISNLCKQIETKL